MGFKDFESGIIESIERIHRSNRIRLLMVIQMVRRDLLTGIFFVLFGLHSLLMFQETGLAQGTKPDSLYLRASANPTGSLAHLTGISQGPTDYRQPVRFNSIDFASGNKFHFQVSIASDSGFLPSPTRMFALVPQRVYRFKISDIPLHEGEEIYPTVEMINRTYPPAGKAIEFPIEIDLTKEDLELALTGNLVTKVIYLEDPEKASPADTSKDFRLSETLFLGEDPVSVAEKFGLVMAIVRLGSRIPEELPNRESAFYFGLPPFTILNPSAIISE